MVISESVFIVFNMVFFFYMCGVISLVVSVDKKGLKVLKNFYINRKKVV